MECRPTHHRPGPGPRAGAGRSADPQRGGRSRGAGRSDAHRADAGHRRAPGQGAGAGPRLSWDRRASDRHRRRRGDPPVLGLRGHALLGSAASHPARRERGHRQPDRHVRPGRRDRLQHAALPRPHDRDRAGAGADRVERDAPGRPPPGGRRPGPGCSGRPRAPGAGALRASPRGGRAPAGGARPHPECVDGARASVRASTATRPTPSRCCSTRTRCSTGPSSGTPSSATRASAPGST